ncbi:MAG: hypothetical protein ASARMPRED_005605 [Alectoria sarmentosa]|nr:MAG: hypothetical protein ASARMPRED_005605 [Alectoria sarmentosa]
MSSDAAQLRQKALLDQFSAFNKQLSNLFKVDPQVMVSEPRFSLITTALGQIVEVIMELRKLKRDTDATHWPGQKALQNRIDVLNHYASMTALSLATTGHMARLAKLGDERTGVYMEDSEFAKHCENLSKVLRKKGLSEGIWDEWTERETANLNARMDNTTQAFEELSVVEEQVQEDSEMELTRFSARHKKGRSSFAEME